MNRATGHSAGAAVLGLALAVGFSSLCHANEPAVCPGLLHAVFVDEPGRILAIDTAGDRAVTLDNYGLTVWSLADPDRPQRMGSWVAPRGWDWHIYDYDYIHRASVTLDGRGFAYVRNVLLTMFDSRLNLSRQGKRSQ